MTVSGQALLGRLAALAADTDPPATYVIAFSGGLDSTVLLHLLASTRAEHSCNLVAVHVDHGLHEDSAEWAGQCASAAAALGIEFVCEQVKVATQHEQGPEAAAREARYRALEAHVAAGDWLLSAHHQDDQVETLLLNLLRGAGPSGLAGMPALRRFSRGWLARPLLDCSRDALRDYAERHSLSWIEDPSNDDSRFDRNFLRREVLPRLESRWPGTAGRLKRSSDIAADAAFMLDELGAIDAQAVCNRRDRLDSKALRALPLSRQRNVLRYQISKLGLATPAAVHLQQIIDELLPAREDASPLVRWPGVEVRRYREHLYILPAESGPPATDRELDPAAERLDLAAGYGALRLQAGAGEGLSDAVLARGLMLRYRRGGEEICPVGQSHTKKLKKLLQEEAVVPWMRDRIPLLFAGDELVAVADLWLAAGAVSRPGLAIHWENRPAIH